MTLSPQEHAKIRQLYFGEHWKVGTIVAQLGIHPDAVKRAIETARFGNRLEAPRASILDPYKTFIVQTLQTYPRLRASRVHQMVVDRGYRGGVATVRRYVATVRPVGTKEGYLVLETLPGEQGQVDWAHFGTLRVGRMRRPLVLFVMVLSFSRRLFARFFLDAQMDNFRRGHVEAFAHFKGVPREVLYDNLKSVVLDRVGEHIRFHPQILELASHYCFAPKPCARYRGNEKGKVERAIQYVRSSFFEARTYRDLDDLNVQLARWNADVADLRRHPVDLDRRSVLACYEQERSALLALAEHPFECDKVLAIRSGKQPYVRFDRNDYSIPHTLVRKPLTLIASETQVRVVDALAVVATHARCYDRQLRITDPEHIKGLVEHKRAARELTGRDRILTVSPHAETFFKELAQRGLNIGSVTMQLSRLFDTYGQDTLGRALAEAVERGAIGGRAVAHICDRLRRQEGAPPPLPPFESTDPRIQNTCVIPHNLAHYDLLADSEDEQ